MLFGVIVNTLFYGAFMYYNRYKNDRPWFRYLVFYLVILETVNWPLIICYGKPEALITSPLNAVLTVLISTPIQLFIAWRVRSHPLVGFSNHLAIISFGGGIATTTVVSIHPDFASFSSFHPEVITWLVSSTACDVFLTASLVRSLWTRKTNVISTDSYINKIICPAFLDMLFFITSLIETKSNFMIDFGLSKLYTNALISTYVDRLSEQD
ncbi:hypothetical protein B0H13DRAFT_2243341 [Mycena leptocephala]|nr:hypothetical protein B0H13DRAFT_2243341 [Mycena leptocephala]